MLDEFPQERISMYEDFSSSIADTILYAYGWRLLENEKITGCI